MSNGNKRSIVLVSDPINCNITLGDVSIKNAASYRPDIQKNSLVDILSKPEMTHDAFTGGLEKTGTIHMEEGIDFPQLYIEDGIGSYFFKKNMSVSNIMFGFDYNPDKFKGDERHRKQYFREQKIRKTPGQKRVSLYINPKLQIEGKVDASNLSFNNGKDFLNISDGYLVHIENNGKYPLDSIIAHYIGFIPTGHFVVNKKYILDIRDI